MRSIVAPGSCFNAAALSDAAFVPVTVVSLPLPFDGAVELEVDEVLDGDGAAVTAVWALAPRADAPITPATTPPPSSVSVRIRIDRERVGLGDRRVSSDFIA